MLKTYQREIKLFELSRDTNRKELKLRKNVVKKRVYLPWLRCNGSVVTTSLQ